MSAKPSLEDTIRKLLNAVEKSIVWARSLKTVEGSGKSAKHFFYCPECLRVDVYFKSQVDYARRRGKRIECFKCKVEMKPVDEQFKADYLSGDPYVYFEWKFR
jgi:predicted SprT family Zn-dependent metalloprotease